MADARRRLHAEILSADPAVQQAAQERFCRVVDPVVISTAETVLASIPDAAVLASGSYGRGDLLPWSDWDLIVLSDQLRSFDVPNARRIEAEISALVRARTGAAPGTVKIEVEYVGPPEQVADLVVLHGTTMRDVRLLVGPAGHRTRYLDRIQLRQRELLQTARANLQARLREIPAQQIRVKEHLARWVVYDLGIRALEAAAPETSSFDRVRLIEDLELRGAMERALSACFRLRALLDGLEERYDAELRLDGGGGALEHDGALIVELLKRLEID